MFEKTKRGTQFLVTKDEDMLKAIVKGKASTKALSPKAAAKFDKGLVSYKAFRSSISDIGKCTAYLVVRTPETRFVGVVHNEAGISGFDTDMAVLAMTRRNETFSIFETFWADGIFWKKYVQYAFRKRIFGGPQLAAVEEEQRKTKIRTNRDGWVNGNTWQEQNQDGFRAPPAMQIGGFRGESEAPINTRGAINFSND